MRIALFHNLPPGGAKRTIYEQAKFLSLQNDVDVFELSSTEESYLDMEKVCRKKFQVEFEEKSFGLFKSIKRDLKIWIKLPMHHRKIASIINRNGYDLALIHGDKLTQAPYLLKYLKIPTIYYCQEWLRIAYEKELGLERLGILKNLYGYAARAIRKKNDYDNLRAAKFVLVNSKFTQNNVKKAYGVNSRVLSLGVDTEVFKPHGLKKINQVLFVGDPVWINGYDLVVSAIKLISYNIRPKIKVIKISKINSFSDMDLAKEYSKSIATICVSYNEPFGLVPLESMSCGTPIVAVNEGGYKETVVNGVTGYLINRDPKKLAEKIISFIQNPKLVEKLGENGRGEVLKKWTWERHVKDLEKILRYET